MVNEFDFSLDYKFRKNKGNTLIALGKFKGFHIGHQELLKKAHELSKSTNINFVIMLYPDNKNSFNKTFFSLSQRKNFLSKFTNLESIMLFNPSKENYSINQKQFMIFLEKNLNVTDVVVGENFTFGNDKFTSNSINALKNKFNTEIINLTKINNQIISTKLMHIMLDSRDLDGLKKALGFNYFIEGIVVFGKGEGTKMGLPTSNIIIGRYQNTLADGVYYTMTTLMNKKYFSITSIMTFEKQKYIETYIYYNFKENFYDEIIQVEFLKFYRDIIIFKNKKDLVSKLLEDIENGKNFHNIKK